MNRQIARDSAIARDSRHGETSRPAAAVPVQTRQATGDYSNLDAFTQTSLYVEAQAAELGRNTQSQSGHAGHSAANEQRHVPIGIEYASYSADDVDYHERVLPETETADYAEAVTLNQADVQTGVSKGTS